jgi:hypothetical protein
VADNLFCRLTKPNVKKVRTIACLLERGKIGKNRSRRHFCIVGRFRETIQMKIRRPFIFKNVVVCRDPPMRRLLLIMFCLYGITSIGCMAHELRDDQDKIRSALLDLYTNQIIDNLIRASNGMPIIQIDYSNATANITLKETAGGSESVATTSSTMFTLPAKTLMMTRNILSTAMGSIGGEHTNQIAVTGSPVITNNEVYDAYLDFLAIPGSLEVSYSPPPEGAAQICKQCGDKYYWVPVEFRKQFFGLALATTAQRGKPIAAPDAYEVTLKGIIGDPVKKAPDLFVVTVEIDKKIPNDSGRVLFTDNTAARIGPYEPPTGPAPAETERLSLYLDLQSPPLGVKTVDEFKAKLPYPKARVYVRGHHPEPPTTNDLLNRVNFQLQQIQFNQLRTGGP